MSAVPETAKAIQAYCLRLLARREHSRKELLNKCVQKGFSKDDILPVLAELAAQGWQDDGRYAESYARVRIQKGYGPIAVRYELQQNGVDAEAIETVLQPVTGHWLDMLVQVYQKKFSRNPQLSRQEWAKRSRFLMQRGFPGDLVNALPDHLSIRFLKY